MAKGRPATTPSAVQLEASALEPLGLERAAGGGLGALRRDRVAEDRQAAVLFPECADTAADTLAGLREAALIRLCLRARAQCGQQYGQQRERDECVHQPWRVSRLRHDTIFRSIAVVSCQLWSQLTTDN